MDKSDIEDDPDETEINSEEEKNEATIKTDPLNQLDFYQADPFAHCQSDRMYQRRSPRYCLKTD